MSHKGLREFAGEEIGALALGQNGFKLLLPNSEVECGVSVGYEHIKYFVAIKCLDASSEIEANMTIDNTDIIFGAFDKVVSKSGGGYIMLYIGK